MRCSTFTSGEGQAVWSVAASSPGAERGRAAGEAIGGDLPPGGVGNALTSQSALTSTMAERSRVPRSQNMAKVPTSEPAAGKRLYAPCHVRADTTSVAPTNRRKAAHLRRPGRSCKASALAWRPTLKALRAAAVGAPIRRLLIAQRADAQLPILRSVRSPGRRSAPTLSEERRVPSRR